MMQLQLMQESDLKKNLATDLLEALLTMKIPPGELYDLRFKNYESLVRLAAGRGALPEVLEKFECEEIVTDGHLNVERAEYYVNVWQRCRRLTGLLKTDVLKLLDGYPGNYAARLIGYARWPALKKTLRSLGWLSKT